MDDALPELGALALVSRLKRLSDCLMQQSSQVYQIAGAGFEPRWFATYAYLYRKGPTSITGLAKGLGVSHPAINKVANELIEAKLVAPYRDRNDKRKRVLALTSAGRAKYEQLEPVWRDIRQSLQSAVDQAGGDFLKSLGAIEESFADKSFVERFESHQLRADGAARVVSFRPEHANAFRDLNERWIGDYFTLEDADRKVLNDPDAAIIQPGGRILIAESAAGEVLGTVALLRREAAVVELAKMAVADHARGLQIGWRLGDAAVSEARDMGAQILMLESNRKLTPAISLYHRLGFKECPFPYESDYSRADIYMELML